MAEVVKRVNETTNVFTAIMVLGITGLLFLIVFGNLSGNLGFVNTSNSTINESGHFINGTTTTLTDAAIDNFVSLTVDAAFNATDGTVIAAGNFTVDSALGTVVGSAGRSANWSTVNFSYTSTFTSQGELDTTNVITNLTGGATQFFTFSNVWFTLLAVVLLIIIVISVIQVVRPRKDGFMN